MGNLSVSSGSTWPATERRLTGRRAPPDRLASSRSERRVEDNLCVQICVLYYILLYEDVRLANMKNIVSSGRKVPRDVTRDENFKDMIQKTYLS